MHRTLAAMAVVAILARPASAEPPTIDEPSELVSGATCVTGTGFEFRLTPGALVAPPGWWARTDAQLRELQESDTRHRAENASLRASARSAPVRWYYLTAAFAAGSVTAFAGDQINDKIKDWLSDR